MHKDICCFIGTEGPLTKELEKKMYEEIKRAINDGYKYFLTSLMTKLDIEGAKMVLEERKKHNIKLICYPKYEEFYNEILFEDEREEVLRILNDADEVTYFYRRRCDVYLRIGTVLICSSGRAIGVFRCVSKMLNDILIIGIKKGVEIIKIDI